MKGNVEGSSLHFLGRFRSLALESEFLQWEIPRDRFRLSLTFVAAGAGFLGFAWNDFVLFGFAPPFHQLIVMRAVFLAWTLGTAWWLAQQPGVRLHQALLTVWMMVVSLCSLYVHSTRPADFMGHYLMNILVLMFLYACVPAPLELQLVPALLLAVGVGLQFSQSTAPHTASTANSVAGALILTNVVGAVTSRELNRSRREQFLAYRDALERTAELEGALAEIQTLRGIIPICAGCKMVRNDKGYWEQVEQFVSRHSAAEFSHGLCPACMKKFDWK